MNKKTYWLLAILLLKFVAQYLIINPVYELHRDEFLHLDQGRHLAWGYISVPPMTSWISWIIYHLGNGVFWVKAVPALFGVLTIYLVWRLAEELKGGLFACVLASLSVLLTAMLRINILYQPNSSDIFFWTLTYYTLVRFITTQRPVWLYAAGLALGFGFLSKYNILFLALGLVPSLLLTQQRKLFLNKHLYFSLLLAFVIVLPNLLWQYQNHFPTLAQLKELANTQLVNVNRFDFLKDQVLLFLAALFVLVMALAGFLFYPPFRPFRFLGTAYFITLALFIFFKAKNYYAIGLYPALFSFGAVYLEKLTVQGWKFYLRHAAIALLLLLSVPFVFLAFPLFGPAYFAQHQQQYKPFGILRWEDGKDHLLPQDFADMLGWKELAQKTDSVYSMMAESGSTLVLCDNYGQAGAINYYSSFKDIRAVSFNADYINWMPLEKPIRNVILVKEIDDEDSTREKEKSLFKRIAVMGEITNPYAREKGTKIFLLQDAVADINERLRKEIENRKAKKR